MTIQEFMERLATRLTYDEEWCRDYEALLHELGHEGATVKTEPLSIGHDNVPTPNT